jgi:putative oxidoreductase
MTNSIVFLVARILLATMFIMSGFGKLVDPGMTAGMIQGAGLPAATALTYLAGAFELLAGLAVLVGFQTRIAASLLALFCLFTAFVFHSGAINIPGFAPEANGLLTVFNGLMMWKNITLAGGYALLAAVGAGSISVDARFGAAAGRPVAA